MPEMSTCRIIKRYANRKLYDTEHSRYVTLDQISEMIRNGDDVKIVDNKTKEDLTTVTLAQIIFEEEKKQRSFLPLGAMRNIIQSGGEWFAEAQRRVQSILPGQAQGRRRQPDAPTRRSRTSAPPSRTTRRWSRSAASPRCASGSSTPSTGSRSGRSRSTARSAARSRASRPIRRGRVNKDVKALADRIAELESKLSRARDPRGQDRRRRCRHRHRHRRGRVSRSARASPRATAGLC